jgi:hypothetical protein
VIKLGVGTVQVECDFVEHRLENVGLKPRARTAERGMVLMISEIYLESPASASSMHRRINDQVVNTGKQVGRAAQENVGK